MSLNQAILSMIEQGESFCIKTQDGMARFGRYNRENLNDPLPVPKNFDPFAENDGWHLEVTLPGLSFTELQAALTTFTFAGEMPADKDKWIRAQERIEEMEGREFFVSYDDIQTIRNMSEVTA